MQKWSAKRRWMFSLLVLASGTLLQTSCSTFLVDALADVASSVATQLIRTGVYDLLGAGTPGRF